ncbi:hypothetical protein PT974_07910 [Cladobotryum mycophilum]|uniref:Uncharacterized protein n=1 Tax=Cladobotryum mycophilum TaxID=491253 RepID=A0ABR0SCY1_9HYPO
MVAKGINEVDPLRIGSCQGGLFEYMQLCGVNARRESLKKVTCPAAVPQRCGVSGHETHPGSVLVSHQGVLRNQSIQVHIENVSGDSGVNG